MAVANSHRCPPLDEEERISLSHETEVPLQVLDIDLTCHQRPLCSLLLTHFVSKIIRARVLEQSCRVLFCFGGMVI